MPKKKKFKPEITRIKLNPEQAVLSCSCYDSGYAVLPVGAGNGTDLIAHRSGACLLGSKTLWASGASVGPWGSGNDPSGEMS